MSPTPEPGEVCPNCHAVGFHLSDCATVRAPDLPPRPGEGDIAARHGSRILRTAIDVAIARQALDDVPLDDEIGIIHAALVLELAVRTLTEACVDAQIASRARWS